MCGALPCVRTAWLTRPWDPCEQSGVGCITHPRRHSTTCVDGWVPSHHRPQRHSSTGVRSTSEWWVWATVWCCARRSQASILEVAPRVRGMTRCLAEPKPRPDIHLWQPTSTDTRWLHVQRLVKRDQHGPDQHAWNSPAMLDRPTPKAWLSSAQPHGFASVAAAGPALFLAREVLHQQFVMCRWSA